MVVIVYIHKMIDTVLFASCVSFMSEGCYIDFGDSSFEELSEV